MTKNLSQKDKEILSEILQEYLEEPKLGEWMTYERPNALENVLNYVTHVEYVRERLYRYLEMLNLLSQLKEFDCQVAEHKFKGPIGCPSCDLSNLKSIIAEL